MPAISIRWHCPAHATLTLVLQISQIPRAIRPDPTIFSVIPHSIEIDTRLSSKTNNSKTIGVWLTNDLRLFGF